MPRFRNIRNKGMIKTIIKAIYSAFIFIFLISICLALWTGYVVFSQSSKSSEITTVIQDIYSSQKSIVLDVIDLSKILIKDTRASDGYEKNNLLVEKQLLTDLKGSSQLDELRISEDNGDNPLGIVIEPSSKDISENNLPDIAEEPLVKNDNVFSTKEMEIGMDMNF